MSEKTNYRIKVTAITEEYFANHKIKEIKQLHKVVLEDIPWLPSAYIDVMTSGTEPATNIEWRLKADKSIGLTWRPGSVYGTNKVINQILCYQEAGPSNPIPVQIPLPATTKTYRMHNLRHGSKYKIWVETVVHIKLTIDPEKRSESDHYQELKDNRRTNVLSEPLIVRIPAPCEPCILNTTGYTSESVDLYWARPNLHSQHKHPENAEKKYNLFRHLLGYRLEVNGIQQRSLSADETVCTLTKCKPQHTYSIVIVALTCLTEALDVSFLKDFSSLPVQLGELKVFWML